MKKFEYKFYYLPILLFILLSSVSILWKWFNFQYTLFDLSIFYNAASQPWSNLLYSTIQQHHYFGDHLSPYTLFLKPLILILPHPLTLAFLQIFFIILGYIPFYNLIKNRLNLNWQKIITYIYFLNFIIFGIILNEFHIELILIPLLITTLYYLENKNYKFFLIFFFLTLITREDVVLWLFALTPILLFKKYPWKWWAVPILSLPYFFLATKIIPYFLAGPSYQFLTYYDWLGDDMLSIFFGIFKNIPKIFSLFFNIYTFEYFLAALLPFFFIPLRKPLYLILGFIPYFLLILGAGRGFAIIKFQYSIFLFIGLSMAMLESMILLQKKISLNKKDEKNIAIIFLILTLGYLQIVWGPWLDIYNYYKNPLNAPDKLIKAQITHKLEANKEFLGSYAFIPMSRSKKTYALSYALTGKQQFLVAPYRFEKPLDQIAIDFQDMINFHLRTPQDIFNQFGKNLEDLLSSYSPTLISDTNVLFEKTDQANQIKLYEKIKTIRSKDDTSFGDYFYYKNLNIRNDNSLLDLSLPLGLNKKIDKNIHIKVTWSLNNDKIISRYYPIAYGVYSTSTWELDDLITTNYKIFIPKNASKGSLELVGIKGDTEISNLSNAKLKIDSEEKLSPSLIIYQDEVSKAL